MEPVWKRMGHALREQGWKVAECGPSVSALPDCVKMRYPGRPAAWLEFLERFSCCVNPSETVWLFCAGEFQPQEANGFSWDELERVSLQAADSGGEAWQESIRQFWDNHLPIGLSVGGAYGYYAIRMSDGAVVRGFEPEFEETEELAPSFRQFAEAIGAGELRL